MYLLFGGENYYACGGMNDYEGPYNTLDDAVARALHKAKNSCSWDWWQIITVSSGVPSMVARSESTPHGVDEREFVDGVIIYPWEDD